MNRQRGSFSLILLFSCIGFLALGGFAYYFSHSTSEETQSPALALDAPRLFQEYRARIEQALNDPSAIQVTLNRNPNQFACLFSNTGSCQNMGGNFLLFEVKAAQEIPLSQIIRGSGLDLSSTLCSTFPSVNCPFQITAKWTPVCGGNACDNTKSMHVRVDLVLNDGQSSAQKWNIERFIEPRISLTATASCARQGGVQRGDQCLSKDAAERVPASSPTDRVNARAGQETHIDPYSEQGQNAFTCPDRIMIQGQEEYAVIDSLGHARVEIPASNGCPNAVDAFIFKCSPVGQPDQTVSRDGQWVQIEAILAPVCEEQSRMLQRE